MQGREDGISVIICTRGRPDGLRRTLESLLSPPNLQTPAWEVLVVYGPTDPGGETAAACKDFQPRFRDRLRVFFEERPGKSNALNTGIAAAEGEILAFTDDDVHCAPDYIPSIRSTFGQYQADGAQGRVLLDCKGGWPLWMNDELAAFMSLRDFGEQVFEWNQNLTGTNMVIRRRVVQEIGGFSPEMGAGAVGFMEDSEFSLRMRHAGFRSIYAPQIVVAHELPRERLTRSFFRERYFRWGRSEAYLAPLPAPLWRFALYTAKQLVLLESKAMWHQGNGDPASALHWQCQARLRLGLLWQHWLFARGHPRHLSPRSFSPTACEDR